MRFTWAGDSGAAGAGRPLLASGLLAGAGLVDVLSVWPYTARNLFTVETGQGVYQVDITGWAWLHVAVGAAVTLAGLLALSGRRGTVPLAVCSATAAIGIDLLFLPYAPIQAVLVVALDLAAVRLLLRHRRAVPGRTPAPPGPDRLSAPRRPGRSSPGPPPGSPTTPG
ncbi:hypothetical protein U2F26_11075 [Micromonospora sp. 4G57]|uniref:DUF7144 domain-containing protein n=1 Tax=Micromonospora sicca TaxID=2202420 RepID=A0ABU5J7R1_9ACTN|nr:MULTISPECIES: hypothetical protein [unclassified Micromonospora]MDZ5443272.1 hypothetical protein [Micromonospora sp. 4G57]MDZ5488611.1 hypothetical protein [Micromonospora sp. 4G53]